MSAWGGGLTAIPDVMLPFALWTNVTRLWHLGTERAARCLLPGWDRAKAAGKPGASQAAKRLLP